MNLKWVIQRVRAFVAIAIGSLSGATLAFQIYKWMYYRVVASEDDPAAVGLFLIFVPVSLFLIILGGMMGAGIFRRMTKNFVHSQDP